MHFELSERGQDYVERVKTFMRDASRAYQRKAG